MAGVAKTNGHVFGKCFTQTAITSRLVVVLAGAIGVSVMAVVVVIRKKEQDTQKRPVKGETKEEQTDPLAL